MRRPQPRRLLPTGAMRAVAGVVGLYLSSAVAGCHLVTDFDESRVETSERRTYTFPQKSDVKGLDILVVVDTRAGSDLAALGSTLADWVQSLAYSQVGDEPPGAFDAGEAALPPPDMPMEYPIHIGFVSSDLGIGPDGQWFDDLAPPGCSGTGEGARLLHPELAGPGEAGYRQPFLVLQYHQIINYQDAAGNAMSLDIATAVNEFWQAVISRPSTCPFQQPLAAATRALEYNLENLGFMRPRTALAVLVLAAEDDCSVLSPEFFVDTGTMTARNPDPFQCFARGVRCDDPEHISEPGEKAHCRDLARREDEGEIQYGPDAPRFQAAAAYAEALEELRAPFPVILTAMAGDPSTVHVQSVGGDPALEPVDDCMGQLVYPGVRLQAFAKALGSELYHEMCTPDPGWMIDEAVNLFQNRSVVRCISDPVVDQDPATAPLEGDCQVEIVENVGQGAQEQVLAEVPGCHEDHTGESYCWELVREPQCEPGLTLYIRPNMDGLRSEAGEMDVGDTVRAACRVEKP